MSSLLDKDKDALRTLLESSQDKLLRSCGPILYENDIDGELLVQLSKPEMTELGLSFGQRKKIQKLVSDPSSILGAALANGQKKPEAPVTSQAVEAPQHSNKNGASQTAAPATHTAVVHTTPPTTQAKPAAPAQTAQAVTQQVSQPVTTTRAAPQVHQAPPTPVIHKPVETKPVETKQVVTQQAVPAAASAVQQQTAAVATAAATTTASTAAPTTASAPGSTDPTAYGLSKDFKWIPLSSVFFDSKNSLCFNPVTYQYLFWDAENQIYTRCPPDYYKRIKAQFEVKEDVEKETVKSPQPKWPKRNFAGSGGSVRKKAKINKRKDPLQLDNGIPAKSTGRVATKVANITDKQPDGKQGLWMPVPKEYRMCETCHKEIHRNDWKKHIRGAKHKANKAKILGKIGKQRSQRRRSWSPRGRRYDDYSSDSYSSSYSSSRSRSRS